MVETKTKDHFERNKYRTIPSFLSFCIHYHSFCVQEIFAQDTLLFCRHACNEFNGLLFSFFFSNPTPAIEPKVWGGCSLAMTVLLLVRRSAQRACM